MRFGITCLATTVLLSAACADDPTRPDRGAPREYAIVVNSVSATVSIFPVSESDSVHTVALDPLSTPTTIAVRDDIALVPLGLFPAVAVIDLAEGIVIDEIPLPAGSGATGVAIVDDSLAFVANPDLNSVTPVRYRSGETGDAIPVGVYPTSLFVIGDRLYVVEANLENFMPAGPSTVHVIDIPSLAVIGTVDLSGTNAAQAASNGGPLFVVQAGAFDSASAIVSAVDLDLAVETEAYQGFGVFANEIVVPLNGTVIVASPMYGLAQFAPQFGEFLVQPGSGFGSGGMNVLGIGLDTSDRLWVLDAGDCASPGRAMRVSGSNGVVRDEATVELCPEAIDFSIF